MKFDQIVLEKLDFLLRKYHFKLVNRRHDYIKLQSNNLVIIVSHNQLENSNILWLGRNDQKEDKVEIDKIALKDFFKSDLILDKLSVETFANNLVSFFENDAQSLLTSNSNNRIDELEKFDLDRSKKYTEELLVKQNLSSAMKDWENKDYIAFIQSIDRIGLNKLPQSYKLKYKIAKEKL